MKSRKRISTCLSHLFQIVCNLCPGWLICLMRKKGFCSLLTSLILGLYYKLNWPKRASAVYWLLGTLLYPWPYTHFRHYCHLCTKQSNSGWLRHFFWEVQSSAPLKLQDHNKAAKIESLSEIGLLIWVLLKQWRVFFAPLLGKSLHKTDIIRSGWL